MRLSYTGTWRVMLVYDFRDFLYLVALTLNDDIPGLDGDLDPLGDLEQFLGVAVAQLLAHVQAIGQSRYVRAVCVWDKLRSSSCERYWCAIWRLECRDLEVDVHVLHLEGCCGLALSTEVVVEFANGEAQLCGGRKIHSREVF